MRPRAFQVLLTFACLLVLAGCAQLGFRRGSEPPGRTTLGSPLVVLPAKVVGNFVIIEAKWDRHGPYHFVIDTGSASTLVTPALVRRHGSGLSRSEGALVRVASPEGGILSLPSATLERMEFGDARFEKVPVLVHDLAELSAHLGIRIDGLLGFPLFHQTLLTLDYPRHRVLLQPLDSAAIPPGSVVRYEDTTGTPMIRLGIGNRSVLALVDSGSDTTFSLNTAGLGVSFAAGPRPGATVGTLAGDHPQEIGRLAEDILLGVHTIARPVVDLTSDYSAVGGATLKHFTVTFDPARDRITFLRDSREPLDLGPRRSAGLSFSKTPAYWRVAGVIRESPAQAAGIQFGDLVTRINGEPVAKWNLSRYEEAIASNSEITFTLLFGTNEVEKRVAIFDLVP